MIKRRISTLGKFGFRWCLKALPVLCITFFFFPFPSFILSISLTQIFFFFAPEEDYRWLLKVLKVLPDHEKNDKRAISELLASKRSNITFYTVIISATWIATTFLLPQARLPQQNIKDAGALFLLIFLVLPISIIFTLLLSGDHYYINNRPLNCDYSNFTHTLCSRILYQGVALTLINFFFVFSYSYYVTFKPLGLFFNFSTCDKFMDLIKGVGFYIILSIPLLSVSPLVISTQIKKWWSSRKTR